MAGATPETKRPFAAKYHHRGWGVALGIFGVLSILVGLGGGLGGVIVGIILGLIPLAISVHLLRGQGVDPKIAQRKAANMAELLELLTVREQDPDSPAAVAAQISARATAAVATT